MLLLPLLLLLLLILILILILIPILILAEQLMADVVSSSFFLLTVVYEVPSSLKHSSIDIMHEIIFICHVSIISFSLGIIFYFMHIYIVPFLIQEGILFIINCQNAILRYITELFSMHFWFDGKLPTSIFDECNSSDVAIFSTNFINSQIK